MKRSAFFITFLVMMPLASFAGIVNPKNVLNRSQVEVCFADWDDLKWADFDQFIVKATQRRNFSPQERKWIKKAITREFTSARTIADFVGWESCIENPQATIFILGGTHPSHTIRARGTRRHFKLPYSPKLFIYTNVNHDPKEPLSSEQTGRLIREFAFALGIADESLRTEAENDPQCAKLPEGVHLTKLKKRELKKLPAFSVYDSDSITHRCNLNPLELSARDIHTIRCIYGFAEKDFDDSNCRADFDPLRPKKDTEH